MQATNAAGTAKATAIVELDGKDLPAHCPNVAMPLWSSHPRIFLDLSHGGSATCPYCGTVYQLKPGTVLHGH
ncbi:MAG: zinc-finger domain-containing protein [Glaciimonas sp.]|nr:zinc-finger domain-containing protein [Glaciimonas sp.]